LPDDQTINLIESYSYLIVKNYNYTDELIEILEDCLLHPVTFKLATFKVYHSTIHQTHWKMYVNYEQLNLLWQ